MNSKDQNTIRQIIREELAAFRNMSNKTSHVQPTKEITYKDDMTFAEAYQKLIVDSGIAHYEWANVDSFFPIDKNGKKIKEKPTGKIITWGTPNVFNLTPEMCNETAQEFMEKGIEFLPPVAYLHWFAELHKEGKHLDGKTITLFPNWRNSSGAVPAAGFGVRNGRFSLGGSSAADRGSDYGARGGTRIR